MKNIKIYIIYVNYKMRHLLFILIFIFFAPMFLFSQWVQQVSGVTTPLYNIEFVNQYTGWATGNSSVILKTTNGGINWFQQTINLVFPKNLYGLDMLNANTGYIAGWFETILKTTNGGTNWQIISNIPTNSGNSNNAVSFINEQTGWICSFLGRVLRTTNGGMSWDTANVGSGGPLEDIQFFNSQTGWVCGDVGLLKKSTNGGINWSTSVFPTSSNLLSLHFIDSNTGWTVSEQQNEVFRTTNGGLKWDTISILPGGSLQYSYTIYFSSSMTGFIGGTNSRLFKSTNGGFNWARDTANFIAFFRNFNFLNDTVGWCVGGHGTLLHTTTGGGPFVGLSQLGNETPTSFSLSQNYPNPFNPTTKIKFSIVTSPVPSKGGDQVVSLKVFDVLGREVATLVNESATGGLKPGTYEVEFDGSKLSSGVYFYKLIAGDFTVTKKMVVVK